MLDFHVGIVSNSVVGCNVRRHIFEYGDWLYWNGGRRCCCSVAIMVHYALELGNKNDVSDCWNSSKWFDFGGWKSATQFFGRTGWYSAFSNCCYATDIVDGCVVQTQGGLTI